MLLMETRPELAGWTRANMLTAALVDAVNMLRWELAARDTPKGRPKPRKPEPIPRPGVRSNVKRYGRDPIPASQFNQWWHRKAIEKHRNR